MERRIERETDSEGNIQTQKDSEVYIIIDITINYDHFNGMDAGKPEARWSNPNA